MPPTTPLVESQKLYLQRAVALDSILITAALAFFSLLVLALYKAHVEKKAEIYAFLPFVIGLFGLFCVYARALTFTFIQSVIIIERDISRIEGRPIGMAAKMFDITWWRVPSILFYGCATLLLLGVFLYSSWRGTQTIGKRRRWLFLLGAAVILLANLTSLAWTSLHISRVVSQP